MSEPVTIGNLYELTDVQTQDGQEVLNVYFYELGDLFITDLPTPAQVLAENFVAQKLDDIRTIQTSALVHNEIRVRNLYNPADSYINAISLPGLDDEDADSNFDAIGFVLQGETTAVRKGAKRIGGLLDRYNTAGVIDDPALVTVLNAAADAMRTPVQVGLIIPSDVFYPTLVKRVRSGIAGAYEYRLPANAGEGVSTRIINTLWNALVTSQVSRKIGIGA